MSDDTDLLEAALEAGRPSDIIEPLLDAVSREQASSMQHHGHALHTCILLGRFDWIRALLDRGWPADASNEAGVTALHLLPSGFGALSAGQPEAEFEALEDSLQDTLGLLIQFGANPNARDHLGRTPLHAAAAHLVPQAARALQYFHALKDIRDKAGRTAADVVASLGAMDDEWRSLVGDPSDDGFFPLPPLPPALEGIPLDPIPDDAPYDVPPLPSGAGDADWTTGASGEGAVAGPFPTALAGKTTTQRAAARRAAKLDLDASSHATLVARLLYEKAKLFAQQEGDTEAATEAWDAVFDAVCEGAGVDAADGHIPADKLIDGLQAMDIPASEHIASSLQVILTSAYDEQVGDDVTGTEPMVPGLTRAQFQAFCESSSPDVPEGLWEKLGEVEQTESAHSSPAGAEGNIPMDSHADADEEAEETGRPPSFGEGEGGTREVRDGSSGADRDPVHGGEPHPAGSDAATHEGGEPGDVTRDGGDAEAEAGEATGDREPGEATGNGGAATGDREPGDVTRDGAGDREEQQIGVEGSVANGRGNTEEATQESEERKLANMLRRRIREGVENYEMPSVEMAFRSHFDSNGDGFVNGEDLERGCELLGVSGTVEEFDRMLREELQVPDGRLSKQAFLDFIGHVEPY